MFLKLDLRVDFLSCLGSQVGLNNQGHWDSIFYCAGSKNEIILIKK